LIKTEDPRAKAFEKSEDPKFVEEHNLPIDYSYYFINKFLNPVCDLLEPLFENPKTEIFGELLERAKPPKKKRVTKGEKQMLISDLFKR